MLRIHFTVDDMNRIRIRRFPHPLWEVLLSIHVLWEREGVPAFQEWRRVAIGRLSRPATVLTDLAPPSGYSPDFLTADVPGADIESAIDMFRRTTTERLGRDIAELGTEIDIGPTTLALGGGDQAAIHRLAVAIRRYHEASLEPFWDRISHVVSRDAALRISALESGGVDRLLAGLHPAVYWQRPVLHVAYPTDQELRLNGRGIELIPSYFCVRVPITLKDPTLPPVLVYPVAHHRTPVRHDGQVPPEEALATLLGRTRAAVLSAAIHGCTTTELAQQLGISAANASHHVTVLRNALLIRTHAYGTTRLHTITRLGAAVLGIQM